MKNLLTMLAEQPDRRLYVELTDTGPVLYQSNLDAVSVNTISTHEVDRATWDQLQIQLQTGQLDNAKVKEIIGVP